MTKQFKDVLAQPEKRKEIIADCETLINEEVASKGGLSGMAVRAAFAMVKAFKPGMIRSAVDGLLDDFATKLDVFYARYQANPGGRSLPDYFVANGGEIADSLLTVTDERAAKSTANTLKKAYEKLRPQGKKNVEEAMPRVGNLVQKHTSA